MTGIIKVDDLKDAGGNSIISSNGSGTFTYTFNAGSIARAALAADIIDGTKLADDAINSEHYTDGSIDTAHIADDQVTLAKMAGLARGKIIYGDSSGNPAALAVGSNNQVLKSDGTDISWGTDSSGTITALNNATANELVTVGSTTTELDSETNLIYNGTIIGCGADGANADLGDGIHIKQSDSSATVHSNADQVVIERNDACGLSILSAVNNTGNIMFGDSGDNDIGGIIYDHTENAMKIYTNAQSASPNLELLNNQSTVIVGQTGGFSNTAEGVSLARNANNMVVDSSSVLNINREGTDGLMIQLLADNSAEGNITSSGTTIQFNTFCGAHWGRLADNSQPTILRGTVMETIDTMIDWYRVKFIITEKRNDEGVIIRKRDESAYEEIALPDGKSVGDAIKHTHNGVEYDAVIEKQLNEQLPMTKISDTEDSKAVYGVFSRWDNEPDDGVNDMNVAALGAFIIRVHKDETVAIGDLLSSKGDGTAKVQADDIMRSKTIAKVTSTNKTYTYDDGSYCVPCTLHCG